MVDEQTPDCTGAPFTPRSNKNSFQAESPCLSHGRTRNVVRRTNGDVGIGRGSRVEMFLESYNTLNRVNYSGFNGSIGTISIRIRLSTTCSASMPSERRRFLCRAI